MSAFLVIAGVIWMLVGAVAWAILTPTYDDTEHSWDDKL